MARTDRVVNLSDGYLPLQLFRHRAVRRMDEAHRYVVARLPTVADNRGRILYDGPAIADAIDADPDIVGRVLEQLIAEPRPLLLRYGDWAQIVGWDSWQSVRYLQRRPSDVRQPPYRHWYPRPPDAILRAAACVETCGASQYRRKDGGDE